MLRTTFIAQRDTMADLTIIRRPTLLTLDAAGTVIEDGEMWIEGERITYAGPSGAKPVPTDRPVKVMDAAGLVAMPGFANCHTHSYAALLKGTVDALPLDVFMVNAILAAGARSARDVYVSAKLGALEMVLTGTTACLDHFSHRPRHTPEALDAVCQAYADVGVRAAVAPMFSDKPFVETIPLADGEIPDHLKAALPATPQPHEPFFEMMTAGLERWAGHDRVKLMLGVDSPQRCSDALLAKAGAFCAEHGIGNHTHLLEAKTQWAMAKGRDSRGFVAFLADHGLAGPLSTFAHFIWFSQEDLANAAEAGVTVVHNPASNLILGSGIAPLIQLIEAGVPVAFGSDGLNAGHLSMFEKTRLAALLPRVCEADPDRWPAAGPILRMATTNGARALGREGKAGTLEEGQLADIVLLDGSSLALSPRGDLPTQVVFYETGASVRHVFIGGEAVVKDGAPAGFDAAELIAEATEIATRLASENQEALEKAEEYAPGLKTMVKRIHAECPGPCRLAQV